MDESRNTNKIAEQRQTEGKEERGKVLDAVEDEDDELRVSLAMAVSSARDLVAWFCFAASS